MGVHGHLPRWIKRLARNEIEFMNEKLGAWWWHRQGLDGSLRGASPAEVLQASGWARSVGGASPYLGIRARAGATREQVDAAVADCAIHELPSVRGCTYVVPSSDFGLALRAAQAVPDGDLAAARKLGVTDRELDLLAGRVLELLPGGPLEPEAIKQAAGPAVRHLGDAGRKKGLTTTLPLVLARLQVEGRIRRLPTNGRLDQQRYRYVLWEPSPTAHDERTPEDVARELAVRFFDWAAPATLGEFRAFSGLGARAAQAAVASLDLQPVPDLEGYLSPGNLLPQFGRFTIPTRPQYVLVGSLDAMILLRSRSSILRFSDAKNAQSFAGNGGLTELPSHAILDRGRLVGLWEFDPDAGEVIWMTFARPDAGLRQTVKETETWIRAELGDVRSFSLDSPGSRKPRLAALREGRIPE